MVAGATKALVKLAGEGVQQAVKSTAKRGTRKAATTVGKKTTQAVAKKVAPAVPLKGIEDQITEAIPTIKATKWGKELSDIQLTAIEGNLRKAEAMNLQPEIENVRQLLDQPEMTEEANQYLDNIRGFGEAQRKGDVQVAARDASLGRAPAQPQQPSLSVSDDLNYLDKNADYTDELVQLEKNQAKSVQGMETAIAKGKNFSEDLLNRRTTIAQIPGQIKKWLKKASQKAKAGIPFEVGDPEYDKLGEFIGSSIKGMTFQELHHELMKSVYSAYVDTAMKLVQAGKGTKMDVINLNHMANSYGFGMGDFGVEAYPRLSHSWSHNELIKEGVQKSGQALKDQVQDITKLPDMQTLTQDFKRSLEELAVPMRRKMDLGKRAYMQLPEADRIKVIQLRGTKDSLKTNLKELMIGEYQQAGIPIPKGDGQQIFKAFKKKGGKPSQEAIDLNKAVDLTRKEGVELSDRMKESIGPLVKDDIELDVKTMEKYIDEQVDLGSDVSKREGALMRESYSQANPSGMNVAEILTGDTYSP
tara:strand:+ start:472 stop:2061 length:1590 start_codon:yes stop_codon:yes gene_type:complete